MHYMQQSKSGVPCYCKCAIYGFEFLLLCRALTPLKIVASPSTFFSSSNCKSSDMVFVSWLFVHDSNKHIEKSKLAWIHYAYIEKGTKETEEHGRN